MKPFFRPATPDDIFHVTLNMKERDWAEISCLRFEESREELAVGLADQYGNVPFVFCFGFGNEQIGILTGINTYPNVWSIGMWSTPSLPKVGKFISEIASNEFFGAMHLCGAHRVECKSIVGYDSVHKWLRFLGFRQRPEVIEKMGKNGEDFLTFEWVDGMPWPRGYKPTAE